jgi:very-short-patch-repair endonuclease
MVTESYEDGNPPKWLLKLIGRKRKKSYLEEKFQWIIYELGFVGFKHNYYVYAKGKHHFIDWAIPHMKLGFECDSEEWHSDLQKDMDRDLRLESKGWKIYHFTSQEILWNREYVADRIVSIIESESKCLKEKENGSGTG